MCAFKQSKKGMEFVMKNTDNLDINQLLELISKMDKDELQKNLYKAQEILNNSNINNNSKDNL
jgi:tRNA isopentenyl-2-thiomethyl-A-37 hydroxylase MiaE